MDGFGYIYKTTNLINGRIYIGQRSGTFTPSYRGSGLEITRAVRKYGKSNFKVEIVGFASDKDALNALEIKVIKEYRESCGKGFLYNIADGGQGGDLGCSLSGESHPNWGKKFSEITKKKLQDARKKRVTKESTKEKLSISFKGHRNPFFGKSHSAEALEINRLAHLGKPRKPHQAGCPCCVCAMVRSRSMNSADTANVATAPLMS